MRTTRQYGLVPTRYFRTELTWCPTCQTRLRRFATLSRRTIITLAGPVRAIHCGYRCPNPACAMRRQVYRSTAADALALPGFTFGLDIVLLVGHLRLAQHQTVDEVHQTLLERLAPWQLTISRREVLYLFDAYCVLLRAAHERREGPEWQAWLAQVQANGGLILSIDGIQPDKGNETVYLVREVLTGRILAAENVLSSRTEVIKQLLAPVVALGLPVLGVVSDAQESILLAVAALWPDVPHQVCQFHYLREAGKEMFEADRHVKVTLRKTLQPKVLALRDQLTHDLETLPDLTPPEREQFELVGDYTLAVQTALYLDGKAPFDYAGLAAFEALDAVEASVRATLKKGRRCIGKPSGGGCACSKSWLCAANGRRRWRRSSGCTAGCVPPSTSCQDSGRCQRTMSRTRKWLSASIAGGTSSPCLRMARN